MMAAFHGVSMHEETVIIQLLLAQRTCIESPCLWHDFLCLLNCDTLYMRSLVMTQ